MLLPLKEGGGGELIRQKNGKSGAQGDDDRLYYVFLFSAYISLARGRWEANSRLIATPPPPPRRFNRCRVVALRHPIKPAPSAPTSSIARTPPAAAALNDDAGCTLGSLRLRLVQPDFGRTPLGLLSAVRECVRARLSAADFAENLTKFFGSDDGVQEDAFRDIAVSWVTLLESSNFLFIYLNYNFVSCKSVWMITQRRLFYISANFL